VQKSYDRANLKRVSVGKHFSYCKMDFIKISLLDLRGDPSVGGNSVAEILTIKMQFLSFSAKAVLCFQRILN
jgi:hypothetical protein